MATRRPTTFYAPGDSQSWQWVADHVVVPVLERFWMRVRHLHLAEPDAARLLEACRGPALLCPNHPSLHEPVLLHHALHTLGLRCNFMMAHSTMQVTRWALGFLKGIGCYSVKRGAADRASFAATKELLRAGRTIAAFPEGETYGLNDTLITFQEGVVQLGFWGVQERQKAGLEGGVKVVPMAFKYRYGQDMRPIIDARLTRLEEALAVRPDRSLSRYERLRRVGFACCEALERAFGLEVWPEGTLNERIDRLYQHVLDHYAATLGVRYAADDALQDKLRRLFAVVHDQLYEAAEAPSPFVDRLQAEREPLWKGFERDLARLQTFQAVRDGYVAAHPSAERYLDVIGRLELQVLGHSKVPAPRRAELRVAEPLDLADRLDAYQADRRGTVVAVTHELRDRVHQMIEELSATVPVLED